MENSNLQSCKDARFCIAVFGVTQSIFMFIWFYEAIYSCYYNQWFVQHYYIATIFIFNDRRSTFVASDEISYNLFFYPNFISSKELGWQISYPIVAENKSRPRPKGRYLLALCFSLSFLCVKCVQFLALCTHLKPFVFLFSFANALTNKKYKNVALM